MFNKTRLFFFAYFITPSITAAYFLFRMPADGSTAILFGLSKSRLLVAAALFLITVFFFSLASFANKNAGQLQFWISKNLSTRYASLLGAASTLIILSAFIALAVPDKYLGELWAIAERLQPLFIWALLFSLQMLVSLIVWQIKQRKHDIEFPKEIFVATGIPLSIFIAVWMIVATTGLGLTGGNSFWSKPGVPLLWPQVLLAMGVGLAAQRFWFNRKQNTEKEVKFDFILIGLIWLTAFILWQNQSYVQGVFNTIPRLPTNEIFPINDSFIFDTAAQKMLIGQEMPSEAHDKPVFIAFLALLHLFAGTSFANFYLLQIACYAFIPVAGYYLGKTLHSRQLGIVFALLLVFKEQNAIALTNYIHVSTSKLILSEMLTTLGVLLFTIFLARWLKSSQTWNSNLWIAGGVLGLTSLVRLNSISIFTTSIFLLGLAHKFHWKRWVRTSIILGAFLLISIIPWMARSAIITKNPFQFIDNKTSGVIINQRYTPVIGANAIPQTPAARLNGYITIGQGITTNYLHNLIGITIMLPPSLELYRLLDLARLPYWKMEWDGHLLPGALWVIFFVLIVTALGIAVAWMRWRIAGLAPLAAILGYNITTAISLTSGGRYLVPMDWGVLFYFSIGLLEISLFLLALFGWPVSSTPINAQTESPKTHKPYPALLATCLLFLFLGASPVLMETLPQKQYPSTVNLADFIAANHTIPDLSAEQITGNLAALSKTPLVKVFYGKALYPRYFAENKGDGPTLEEDALIGSANFDRLSFFLVGGVTDTTVVLPVYDKVSINISGADTWVIGCQKSNHIEALLVIFRAQNTTKVFSQEPFKTNCE